MRADDRRSHLRGRTVAFKADAELADFLRSLPNASEFIRQAVLAQFRLTCPLCTGSGVVARGVGEHYEAVIARFRSCVCTACGAAEPIPADADAAPEADRRRWEQFFNGGPFTCAACYDAAPSCGDCGWRLPSDLMSDHLRDRHPSHQEGGR